MKRQRVKCKNCPHNDNSHLPNGGRCVVRVGRGTNQCRCAHFEARE